METTWKNKRQFFSVPPDAFSFKKINQAWELSVSNYIQKLGLVGRVFDSETPTEILTRK